MTLVESMIAGGAVVMLAHAIGLESWTLRFWAFVVAANVLVALIAVKRR